MDTLKCASSNFLQRNGLNCNTSQIFSFLKCTFADYLNILINYNFLEFLITLERFICNRCYFKGIISTLNSCWNNKFCFLAPNSNFSHYKDKKNIGTEIFFAPKTSLN